MSFNYTEGSHVLRPSPRATDKRGASSATQRMLLERQAEINAQEQATGQPPTWDQVYSLMRCSSGACELGPHCWRDPINKKHIKLTVQNLRALVGFVEEGGVLKTHDDVPESIREKLYIQEQQRLDRHKGGTQSTNWVSSYKHHQRPSCADFTSFCANYTDSMPTMCPGKGLRISSRSLVYGTLLLLNIVTGSNNKSTMKISRQSFVKPAIRPLKMD